MVGLLAEMCSSEVTASADCNSNRGRQPSGGSVDRLLFGECLGLETHILIEWIVRFSCGVCS